MNNFPRHLLRHFYAKYEFFLKQEYLLTQIPCVLSLVYKKNQIVNNFIFFTARNNKHYIRETFENVNTLNIRKKLIIHKSCYTNTAITLRLLFVEKQFNERRSIRRTKVPSTLLNCLFFCNFHDKQEKVL